MHLGLVLHSRATLSGVEVCDLPEEAFPYRKDQRGRQLRVDVAKLRPISIASDPSRPREIVTSLLNCRDVREDVFEKNLAAFTSRYGLLIDVNENGEWKSEFLEHEGSIYYPVEWCQSNIEFLLKFAELCRERDGAAIKKATDKWQDKSKSLYYELALDKSGNLAPSLITPALFIFCMHELLTSYYESKPLATCRQCGMFFYREGRSDRETCSPRCRMAASRLRRRKEA